MQDSKEYTFSFLLYKFILCCLSLESPFPLSLECVFFGMPFSVSKSEILLSCTREHMFPAGLFPAPGFLLTVCSHSPTHKSMALSMASEPGISPDWLWRTWRSVLSASEMHSMANAMCQRHRHKAHTNVVGALGWGPCCQPISPGQDTNPLGAPPEAFIRPLINPAESWFFKPLQFSSRTYREWGQGVIPKPELNQEPLASRLPINPYISRRLWTGIYFSFPCPMEVLRDLECFISREKYMWRHLLSWIYFTKYTGSTSPGNPYWLWIDFIIMCAVLVKHCLIFSPAA